MTGVPAALEIVGGRFTRRGRPHQILAGAMHPFRVHPGQWADRIARVAALGCNTIDIYVAWNAHQPDEDRAPSFTGFNDLARFAGLVADEGLDLIVRPGPYICAEWDNGALPAWLTRTPGIRLRVSDPVYEGAVAAWLDHLIPQLAPLQAAYGGPIVAMQVENEYGSYADDHEHVSWLRRQLRDRGVTELLFTADGATWDMQEAGSIAGTFAAATFGSRPEEAAALMARRQPGAPLFGAEFWGGWFDHWGEGHHVREADDAAGDIARLVRAGGSLSIYMAHGGTNFGLRSGANHDGSRLQPTVTSYDSDAPVAEDGSVGEKFVAIRRALRPEAAADPLPETPPRLPAQTLPVVAGRELLDALTLFGDPRSAPQPLSFEELGLDAGLVLYSTRTALSAEAGPLRILGLHDRATVMVDGRLIGAIEHETQELALPPSAVGRVRVDLVVENQGRINYGALLGQGKGIVGGVLLERRFVTGWSSRAVALDRWTPDQLRAIAVPGARPGDAHAPGVYTAVLRADAPADAFLALPGFAKGFVWIDGFLLGRYWERGPQETLYVPAPLVRDGAIVTVLELERAGDDLRVVEAARLGPPDVFTGSM